MARWRLGLAFERVSTIPEGERLGAVSHRPPGAWFRPDVECTTRTRLRIEAEVISHLAGGETERAWVTRTLGRQLLESEKELVDVGMRGDLEIAVNLSDYATSTPEEAEAYFAWLWQRTLDLISGPLPYWAAVEALADAVVGGRALAWRDAKPIILVAWRSCLL